MKRQCFAEVGEDTFYSHIYMQMVDIITDETQKWQVRNSEVTGFHRSCLQKFTHCHKVFKKLSKPAWVLSCTQAEQLLSTV